MEWTDADELAHADIVVLRSNWDFHHHMSRFKDWLDEHEALGTNVVNPIPLVRWSLDKRNLMDLLGTGLRLPHTASLDQMNDGEAAEWARGLGLDPVVVKPAWGAGGHAVGLVAVDELPAYRQRLEASGDGRPYLMQEYLPSIVDGEQAFVYFKRRVFTPDPATTGVGRLSCQRSIRRHHDGLR